MIGVLWWGLSQRGASQREWLDATTEVAELFSSAIAAEPELKQFILRLSFVIDDIISASDAELKRRALAESEKIVPLVLWALRDSRAAERIMASCLGGGDG